MTKEKLIKYFEDYLQNEYCALVDFELELEAVNHPLKDRYYRNVRGRYDNLMDICALLKKID